MARSRWVRGAMSDPGLAFDDKGDGPVTTGTVSMRTLGEDVAELLDGLDISTTAIVGISMGGVIAMEMVAAQPWRYWSVGLIATTAEVVTDGPHCPTAVRARVDAMMLNAPPPGAAASLRGRVGRPDYRPGLTRIDVPIFVCAGTEDPWSNAEVSAEIVEHLTRPEVCVIDGVGHLPDLEAETRFNDALGTFPRASR